MKQLWYNNYTECCIVDNSENQIYFKYKGTYNVFFKS